ncbi:MAG: hypothetical protein J5836_00680 [Clostridia bacterium]|nr:hypothetical protein [Clostridia bacterium]
MKNKFAIVIATLLALCFTVNLAACDLTTAEKSKKTNDELYSAAVKDAMIIDDDEILPLVNISKQDENVIWDGERVLVAFMHKYPSSYPAGEDITLQWGNVWCVSAAEMSKWVLANGKGVEDWSLRLHQVLGMPTSKNYTTITALWIDANLLYRPANVTDVNSPMAKTYQATGDETFDNTYKAWFDSNIIWSYFDSAFPWTRLGYTYDWADNGTEYGLSEFLIFSGAEATIEYTYSIEEYVDFVRNAAK